MGWVPSKNAIFAFALTFALLVMNGVLSYRNTLLVAEKERRVAHTHEVLDVLQTVLSTVADAETGQRGYLITGQLRFLQPYDSARDRIQEEIEHLTILSADNSGLQQGIPSLEQQIAVAFNTMKQAIEVRKVEGSDAARWLALIDRGKMEMDDIRQLVAGMKQEENDRLRRRVELSKATTQTALAVVSSTTILGVAFVGLCFYLVNHNSRLRLQVEKQLRRANERFELAALAVTSVIYEWDLQTNTVERSKGLVDLYGYRPDEVDPNADWFFKRLHLEDQQRVQQAIEAALTNASGYTIEYRSRNREEQHRWIWDRAVIVRNGEGRAVRVVGSALDITDRKRAEAALQEADQRKNEFLATLAHELRNPLASLLNAVQILRLGAADLSTVEQASHLMERQLKYMNRLIDDLLDVSRISRGKIQLRKERFDLSLAVTSAVEMSRPLIDARRHELTISLSAEPVWVVADLARLAQVVTNLLNNAVKYTNDGGHIWLMVEREGNEAVVKVRDTGVGIPADMLPRVFDLFMQVDRSVDHSQGGLGIGLNLVRRLVELHGGRVAAHSGGPGQGSEFIVRLPALSEKKRAESANRGMRLVPDQASGRILAGG
jgi:PAS domain S-box-containing protein